MDLGVWSTSGDNPAKQVGAMLRELGELVYKKVEDYDEYLKFKDKGYQEAAHCMIYAKWSTTVVQGLKNPAAIMVHTINSVTVCNLSHDCPFDK